MRLDFDQIFFFTFFTRAVEYKHKTNPLYNIDQVP